MTKTNTVATLPIEAADLNAAASLTAAGIVELATSESPNARQGIETGNILIWSGGVSGAPRMPVIGPTTS